MGAGHLPLVYLRHLGWCAECDRDVSNRRYTVETGIGTRLMGNTGAFGHRAEGLPTDYWFVGGASQSESEKGAAYCAGVGHIFVQAFGYALVELEQSLHRSSV